MSALVYFSFSGAIPAAFWGLIAIAAALVHLPVRLSPLIAFQGAYPILFFLVYNFGHPAAWIAAIFFEAYSIRRDHPKSETGLAFFAAARMAAICAYLAWAGAGARDLTEFASYPVHLFSALGLIAFISIFNWLSIAVFGVHKPARYIGTTGISYDVARYGLISLFTLLLASAWEVSAATESPLAFWAVAGFIVSIQTMLASWQESEERTKLIKRKLVSLIDWRDRYAGSRSAEHRDLCVAAARFMKWSPREIDTVNSAALLHDVGKISIPDAILQKQTKLTAEEFETVKKHVAFGASELSEIPGFESAAAAILEHHERWDGGGYPAGKKAGEISKAGRLLAIGDSFISMVSSRPFRPGLARDKAIAAIEAELGRQFAPDVGGEFLSFMREGGEPLDHLIFFPVRPA